MAKKIDLWSTIKPVFTLKHRKSNTVFGFSQSTHEHAVTRSSILVFRTEESAEYVRQSLLQHHREWGVWPYRHIETGGTFYLEKPDVVNILDPMDTIISLETEDDTNLQFECILKDIDIVYFDITEHGGETKMAELPRAPIDTSKSYLELVWNMESYSEEDPFDCSMNELI